MRRTADSARGQCLRQSPPRTVVHQRVQSSAAARACHPVTTPSAVAVCCASGRLWLGTPTERLQHMAEPFTKRFQHVRGTLGVGVHLRMGDSGLPNAKKRNDRRIPLE